MSEAMTTTTTGDAWGDYRALRAALQRWMTEPDEARAVAAWGEVERLRDAGLRDERRMRRWPKRRAGSASA